MDKWEIETDVDYIGYQSLTVLRKLLRDELKKDGKETFLGNYYTKIGFYTKTWRYVEIRYLLALLEYLNPEFQYTGVINIGRTIVTDEDAFKKIVNGDAGLLDKLRQGTPLVFIKYGFLTVDEIGWYKGGFYGNNQGVYCDERRVQ
ncbi:hypothetical protein CBFG_01834 [Clostridiales bacterium 1_7_47FAA]|uniref:Uncharacterized protein n=1 Tax=Enterocloster hominis (ex Hitch et al. 2024) TaxID=1917870 RepID=A0ABV1D1F3_9FIRM|nr:hypothetical protein CBFG_01834 [Clostridiales bacterium 1_7_47FAA]